MGRTQGKGCYCFVNGLLQAQLSRLQNNYPYIVVANEAGMEHISRGVLPGMQTAILVSEAVQGGYPGSGQSAFRLKSAIHPQQISPDYKSGA